MLVFLHQDSASRPYGGVIEVVVEKRSWVFTHQLKMRVGELFEDVARSRSPLSLLDPLEDDRDATAGQYDWNPSPSPRSSPPSFPPSSPQHSLTGRGGGIAALGLKRPRFLLHGARVEDRRRLTASTTDEDERETRAAEDITPTPRVLCRRCSFLLCPFVRVQGERNMVGNNGRDSFMFGRKGGRSKLRTHALSIINFVHVEDGSLAMPSCCLCCAADEIANFACCGPPPLLAIYL